MKMQMGILCVIKFLYKSTTFSLVRVFFYIVIPFTIYILPANIMDSTSLCLIYHLFHVECFMCGMTRAFFHLIHFDLTTAMSWNPLSPYVFIFVVIIVIIDCINIYKTLKERGKTLIK